MSTLKGRTNLDKRCIISLYKASSQGAQKILIDCAHKAQKDIMKATINVTDAEADILAREQKKKTSSLHSVLKMKGSTTIMDL